MWAPGLGARGEAQEAREAQETRCRPIESYAELQRYTARPPGWAALCRAWEPPAPGPVLLSNVRPGPGERPPHYCHYTPYTRHRARERHEPGALPRALLCHDMANGYHDDSYIDGTANYEAYNFYNWSAMDIFCYFSHHFVTIPPLGWINAAHQHGVKVIGTVITEWKDGAAIWDQILSSEKEYRNIADTLVAITKHFKFEGWLLNIENKISKPESLLDFVKYFHEQLHETIPGAELIWYDSVTIKGDLTWQNALNQNNIDFFQACDGIFTNYSWTEAHVADSTTLAASLGRKYDLYIGLDVWGRNFIGGGQFNTSEALNIVHRNGCSVAIFAPAWTHEATNKNEIYPRLGDDLTRGDKMASYQQFLLRDKALWDSLWPYLSTRIPTDLPFTTSFCRGQGLKKRLMGNIVDAQPWFNLREMQYQPNALHGPHGYKLVKVQKCRNVALSKTIAGVIVNQPTVAEVIDTNNCLTQNCAPKKNVKIIDQIKVVFKNAFKRRRRSENTENSEVDNTESHATQKIEIQDSNNDTNKDLDDPVSSIEIDDTNTSSTHQDTRNSEIIVCTSTTPVTSETCIQFQTKDNVTRYKLVLIPDDTACIEYYPNDSFNGGSCLKIDPNSLTASEYIQLFHCDFACDNNLIFYYATKNLENNKQYINMICTMLRNELEFKVILEDEEAYSESTGSPGYPGLGGKHRRSPVKSEQLETVRKYLLTRRRGFYVPMEDINDWNVRYFVLDFPGTALVSISIKTGLSQGAILLGQIGICPQ